MGKFTGIVGAVLLGFGIIGGLVIDSFTNHIVLFHMIVGFACVLMWFISSGTEVFGNATQIIQGRSTRYGANAVILVVMFLGILTGTNWIVNRHNKRWDLTEQKVYSLALQTTAMLDGLKTPLKLVAFKTGADDQKLKDLLKMYKDQNPSKISTEFIDPGAKPQLVEKYGMKSGNLLYIELGVGDLTAVSRINESSEEALTNAILKLTRGSAKKVYFVVGHEEPDITSQKPDGFMQLSLAMKDEHLNVDTLLVAKVGTVPTDASAVILASPKKPLLPEEKKALVEYAKNGGRLLLLNDPRTTGDVTEIAATFGITVNQDVVLDQMQRLFAGPTIGAEPIAVDYDPQSPITRSFTNQNITIYNIASSVIRTQGADKEATYSEFVKTSPTAWGETDVASLLDAPEPQAQKDAKDFQGPLSLAVSYEKKLTPSGKNKEKQEVEKVSRVVVFGDTDWLQNANMRLYANRDLFLNAVNWVAGEEGGVTIRSGTLRGSVKPIARETLLLILLSSFIVPEVILLIGLFVWARRRNMVTVEI